MRIRCRAFVACGCSGVGVVGVVGVCCAVVVRFVVCLCVCPRYPYGSVLFSLVSQKDVCAAGSWRKPLKPIVSFEALQIGRLTGAFLKERLTGFPEIGYSFFCVTGSWDDAGVRACDARIPFFFSLFFSAPFSFL